MAFKIKAGEMVVAIGAEDSRLRSIMGRTARIMRPVQNAMMRLSRISRNMLIGGVGLAGLTAKAAASFEKSMSRVKALTSATGVTFEALRVEAKRLGETTVFTANQAAEAMGAFALAGFEAEQIIDAMAPTLNLAAAGQLDMGQAAAISARIMAAMGIEAANLGGAVDVLAKAFTTAQTDLVMLGEAFRYLGPIAKDTERSLEEVTATIQILSNVGIQASMAGTSMRAIISRLAGSSKEATKILSRFVQIIDKNTGQIRPLADIIDDLNMGMSSLESAERTGLLMQAFGLRAGPAMVALLSAGGEAIRTYEKALKNAGGTADFIARTQLDNLDGTITRLKSKIQDIAIAIGEAMLPVLRQWVEHLISVATIIRRLTARDMEGLMKKAKTLGKVLVALWLGPKIIAGIVALGKVIWALTAAVIASTSATVAHTLATIAERTALAVQTAATAGASLSMAALGSTIVGTNIALSYQLLMIRTAATSTSTWAATVAGAAVAQKSLAIATWAAMAPLAAIAIAIAIATAAFAYFTYQAYKAKAAQAALAIESLSTGRIMKEIDKAQKELDLAKGIQEQYRATHRLVQAQQQLLDTYQDQLKAIQAKAEGDPSRDQRIEMSHLKRLINGHQKIQNADEKRLAILEKQTKVEEKAEKERVKNLSKKLKEQGIPDIKVPEIKTKATMAFVGLGDMWRRMQEASAAPDKKKIQLAEATLAESKKQTELQAQLVAKEPSNQAGVVRITA